MAWLVVVKHGHTVEANAYLTDTIYIYSVSIYCVLCVKMFLIVSATHRVPNLQLKDQLTNGQC